MVKTKSWEKVLQFKERIVVIKYELGKLDRNMRSEFRFKQAPEKRKYQWEQMVKKKAQLEKELADTWEQLNGLIGKNNLNALTEENKKKARKKK